ncbi:tartrate-resistant acid phosphatase type 5-like [Argiope bruennichi]|uniref:Tartrate-resistant acid phosphatase type 5 n=1 Tax=Argiope bruennichi TaxID=94029 RepID=A0A8T0F1I5_ARGBR|nr:tartrate-resistant acid phosphatase type 5-like [Argiope bruennichi]KAF8782382.1 Tartrate-resistant acid phosphatase type 5 like protein [Argiope bruennichi]
MYKFAFPLFLFIAVLLNDTSCSKTSLRLEVIADWGGLPVFPYKTFVELAVGREMAYLASKLEIDAVLALGDNFYLDGVKSVNDLRFKETFETAFNYESLHVPWLVVAGNHDYYGNVSAQIAYTKISDRWFFPDFYYVKRFTVPMSNMTADVIMIDTVLLCGYTSPEHPYEQPLLDSIPLKTREKHWKWLEDTLKLSRANYVLVCGHYPVYSIATHGPTKCLVDRLQPLLFKYNVTAYFSGHDHNLQHIQVLGRGQTMDYFVTGSANFIDPSTKNIREIPPGSLRFHWNDPFSLGAFSYLDINASNMTVTFVLSNGKILYISSKKPRYYN